MPTTLIKGVNALYTARAALLDYFEDCTPHRGRLTSHTTIGCVGVGSAEPVSILILLHCVNHLLGDFSRLGGSNITCSIAERDAKNGWVKRFYTLTWPCSDEQWFLDSNCSNTSREVLWCGKMTFSVSVRAPRVALRRS